METMDQTVTPHQWPGSNHPVRKEIKYNHEFLHLEIDCRGDICRMTEFILKHLKIRFDFDLQIRPPQALLGYKSF